MKKLPKSFQRVLWSYNIDKMDIKEDKEEIITQVLNFWTKMFNIKIREDIYKKAIFTLIPDKEIRDIYSQV